MKIGINSLLIPFEYLLFHLLLTICFGPKEVVGWYPLWFGIITVYFLAVIYFHATLLLAYVIKIAFEKAVLLCAALYLAALLIGYLLTDFVELSHLFLSVSALLFLSWGWFLDKAVFR